MADTYRKFDWNRARSDFFTLFTDFMEYVAGDWVVTVVGTGTQALSATEPGGVLDITNTAADDDAVSLQYAGGTGSTLRAFQIVAGKKVQAVFRGSLSDATATDFVFGLAPTDLSPFSLGAAAVAITKTAPATEFSVTHGGTSTPVGVNAADGETFEMEIYYDGAVKEDGTPKDILFFINGTRVHKMPVDWTNAEDEPLTLTFGVRNGEAAAKTMLVDYAGASQQR